jgi:hypothetical protein
MNKVAVLAVVILTACSGCGKKHQTFPTARLEGRVTLDGTPVPAGLIIFRSKENPEALPTNGEITDGVYSAKGVPLGKVSVTINARKPTGKTYEERGLTVKEEIKLTTPKAYGDGSQVIEVQGDKSGQNFEMKSDPIPDPPQGPAEVPQ